MLAGLVTSNLFPADQRLSGCTDLCSHQEPCYLSRSLYLLQRRVQHVLGFPCKGGCRTVLCTNAFLLQIITCIQ